MLYFVYISLLVVMDEYVCVVVYSTLAWKNGYAECQRLNNKSNQYYYLINLSRGRGDTKLETCVY